MCTNHSEPHSWIGLAWVCKWMLSIQWLKSNTKVYSFIIISDAILTKINQVISTPNNKYFIQAKPSRQSSILFCVKQRLIQEYSPLLPDIWILSDYFSSSENHKNTLVFYCEQSLIQKVFLLDHSLSHSYRHGLRLEPVHEELQRLVGLR